MLHLDIRILFFFCSSLSLHLSPLHSFVSWWL